MNAQINLALVKALLILRLEKDHLLEASKLVSTKDMQKTNERKDRASEKFAGVWGGAFRSYPRI